LRNRRRCDCAGGDTKTGGLDELTTFHPLPSLWFLAADASACPLDVTIVWELSEQCRTGPLKSSLYCFNESCKSLNYTKKA
jgi:hypothetical protein